MIHKTNNTIRDGQTRDGYVQPIPGLHEGCRFKFRMMLAEQTEAVQQILADPSSYTAAQMIHAIAKAVSNQLAEWSEEVAIDFDTVRSQPYVLLKTLYRIVAGLQPSDVIPTNNGEKAKQLDETIDRVLDGRPPVQSVGELQKN